MRHAMASGVTALGDTVRTSMGTLTVPTKAKKIVGVWGYATGGPGDTTLEHISGIMEFESKSLNLNPMMLPLDVHTITGTGVSTKDVRIWPVNWDAVAGAEITCYMTLDMAITLANTGRWGFLYD